MTKGLVNSPINHLGKTLLKKSFDALEIESGLAEPEEEAQMKELSIYFQKMLLHLSSI